MTKRELNEKIDRVKDYLLDLINQRSAMFRTEMAEMAKDLKGQIEKKADFGEVADEFAKIRTRGNSEADLFTAAEEKKEQGAVHNNMRKYYRDKKRPQVRSWARRFNIPVKVFCYGMRMCGIEGVAVTPRDTTEMQYKRLTEQEANQVFRLLCEKVGELK